MGGVPGQVPPPGGYPVRYPPRGGTRSGTPPGGYPVRYPPGGTRSGTPRGGTRSGTPPGGVPGQVPPGGGYPVRYPPWGGTRSGTPPGGGTQSGTPPGCPMAFWEMLQSIMGYGYPPPVDRQTPVKTVPSRRTTYAGGKYYIFFVTMYAYTLYLYFISYVFYWFGIYLQHDRMHHFHQAKEKTTSRFADFEENNK